MTITKEQAEAFAMKKGISLETILQAFMDLKVDIGMPPREALLAWRLGWGVCYDCGLNCPADGRHECA